MGSHPHIDPTDGRVDVWVMCAKELQDSRGAPRRVIVSKIPLSDDGYTLTEGQAREADFIVDGIVHSVLSGKTVLVTCAEGRNRSGLLTALAVRQLEGVTGKDAVRIVRSRRQAKALTNRLFVMYLESLD